MRRKVLYGSLGSPGNFRPVVVAFKTRAAMASIGRAVTPNDMFIAAHALAIGATVVTGDEAFKFVPGLKVENWLQPQPE